MKAGAEIPLPALEEPEPEWQEQEAAKKPHTTVRVINSFFIEHP